MSGILSDDQLNRLKASAEPYQTGRAAKEKPHEAKTTRQKYVPELAKPIHEVHLSEPDFDRPFEQADFRGYFKWTPRLTSRLGGRVYHACHKQELERMLRKGVLGLRSEWSLVLPEHGRCSVPGTWVGLDSFSGTRNGNYFGPLLLEFPLRVLNNRQFMVFRRQRDRKRYFFVQYEARIPIYSFGKKKWRIVRPEAYFDNANGERLTMKDKAMYCIVVTQPIALDRVSVSAVRHLRCRTSVCAGLDLVQAQKRLATIATDELHRWLSDNEEYRKLVNRFKSLAGQTVELPDPEDDD